MYSPSFDVRFFLALRLLASLHLQYVGIVDFVTLRWSFARQLDRSTFLFGCLMRRPPMTLFAVGCPWTISAFPVAYGLTVGYRFFAEVGCSSVFLSVPLLTFIAKTSCLFSWGGCVPRHSPCGAVFTRPTFYRYFCCFSRMFDLSFSLPF